jgi:putative hydrolase of the HAD superfamily
VGSNGSTPSIEVVAFDGDDTLWHSESHFVDAHQRFCALLAPYVDDPARIDDQVIATERQNLALYGYGSKAFTLSLIETAITLTGARISADEIRAILELGKRLLDHPVELLDGVEVVVDEMAASGRRLIIVTKGDLFHQEAKVAGSGLADRFERVEIVSEKDVPTYRRVMEAVGVPPDRFFMIGNSVKSDVLPVIELGGHAAHLPYTYTWEFEHVPDADAARQGFYELESIHELPALVESLSSSPGRARGVSRDARSRSV